MTKPIKSDDIVMAVWRPPFAETAAETRVLAAGCTLGDLVGAMPCLPPDFARRGVLMVAGHEIKREHWHRVRPKPGHKVTMHYPLAGGGGEGGGKRSILSLIIAVATILTAGFAAAGGFWFLGAAFKAGEWGAQLLAAGISLAGSLAARALTPPPVRQQENPAGSLDRTKGPASISGNLLSTGAPIPRVLGSYRVYPNLAGQPLVNRIGDDEFAEAVFVLAGPHELNDIRIGDTPIADAEDIEIQVREGWDDDPDQDLVPRYGVISTPQLELSTHVVDGDNEDVLSSSANPVDELPQWHRFKSSQCDEVWMHLLMPGGLFDNQNPDSKMVVPFRMRMRPIGGGDWINLPELHFQSNKAAEIRPTILLKFAEEPDRVSEVAQQEGWVAAYTEVPAQADPPSAEWTADGSFEDGAGDGILYAGVEGSTNVQRVQLNGTVAEFYLDAATFPPGRYQIEIKRGLAFYAASFSKPTYTYSGVVYDWFWYIENGGVPALPVSRENVSDRCAVVRLQSVVNAQPIASRSGLAVIAVRAKNRRIENLSVLASGYVRDWDGSGWNTWTTTSNPAPHYRDVLDGLLTPDPIDAALIDNASLVAWRAACISAGYTCDMVAEGDAIDTVLEKIAGCGYARPRWSETWGVIRDYDRSEEDPVQIFTSRNSTALSMSKAFPRLPDAFRAVWYEASEDYAERQAIIYRPSRQGVVNPRIEEVRYEGLTSEADVLARASFDLKQAELRSAFWRFRAPAEAIRCTRGDLIAVNHDTVDRKHAAGRVTDVDIDNDTNQITGVWLDAEVPVWNEPDMLSVTDMLEVEDMLLVGAQTSVGIRRTDGSITTHPVAGVSGERQQLVFETPVAVETDDDDDPLVASDCLAWVGAPSQVTLRLIVASITYDQDQTASIVAVDEAPALFA